MLNGNVLGLVPFVLIVAMIIGLRVGNRSNRWLMRIAGALSVAGAFAFLGFLGPWLAYDMDFKATWMSRLMKHDVFNSLMFNFSAALLAFGGGLLMRSIARGKTPEQDMFKPENDNKRSPKMAIMSFLAAAFFLSMGALAVFSYVTITDRVHVKMPIFPYLVTWCPTLATLLILTGRNRLNPERDPAPKWFTIWMFILLGASVLFAMTGIEM